MDYNIFLPALFTTLVGVLGYFIRRLITSHDKLKSTVNGETKEIKDELARVKVEYLRHEEFVRYQNSIDMKLSQIYDILVQRR